MVRSCLCDYSDAYILVKETITAEAHHNANKNVILKDSASFTNYISRINNT